MIGGSYCPYCSNSMAEFRKDPDGFDIHDHAKLCRNRLNIARAAGQDAGNRSMKRAGRKAWNEDDWDSAADETSRLLSLETAK